MKNDNNKKKIVLSKTKKKEIINEDVNNTEILVFDDDSKNNVKKEETKNNKPKKKLKLKIFNKKNKKSNKKETGIISSKTSKKEIRKRNELEDLKNNSYRKNKRNNGERKKEISKPFILFLILFGIISFIVCYFIFNTFISLAFLLIYIMAIVITQILDNTPKSSKLRKLIKTLALIAIIIAIIGVLAFAAFFTYVVIESPEFDVTKLERGETTLIYDNKNVLVATLGSEKREKLTYDELPEILIDAVIATEDSRYFQHNGFDAPRFIKATIGQIMGRDAGGASTLTMQVAKNNFTSLDATGFDGIVRKFTDIYLSIFKIERAFTKKEVIEFYVNAPFLGSNSYGVEQASQTYFGKSAKDMNLSEAALIAGLFQAPGAYDPNLNPESAYERRAEVLSLMVRHGYITQEEADIANDISIEALLKNSNSTTVSPYQAYIDIVVEEIENETGLDPYFYPMIVYTNMDTKKQEAVNAVFEGKSYKWPNSTIQAGVAVVETNSGKILAIGGGRNRENKERIFSFATDINRQIGSTAKPLFDYAPGFEYNNWSTGKMFNDVRISYAGGYMENFDGAYRGKMTLREALRQSINVPALQAFREVNNEKIKNFVLSVGIEPEIDSTGALHEAHSVGAFNGSNPLTMAAAYAPFSNGGSYYKPYSVNKIILRDSNEELEFKSDKTKVMSESTAYMITNILEMVASDTGVRYKAGTPVALKTGTTNYDYATRQEYGYPYSASPDGWIVGYSTNISMAMWTGYNENQKGVYLTHSNMVSHRNALYGALASGVFDKNSGSFKKPSSVVSVTIEKNTNPIKLPSQYTPSNMKITELFKRGTEPTDISKVYVPLENVTELKLTTEENKAILSWNAAPKADADLDTKNYGDFGYYIYKDGKSLGFTKDTTYTYTGDSLYGTYKVVTGYSKVKTNLSSGTTISLAPNITFQYNGTETTDIKIGETYIETSNPITVIAETNDVTSSANIEITILDSNNNIVSTIDTSVIGTYTVQYKATYLGESQTFTKTVNIIE